jgi:hypothetical protein
MEKLTKDLEKLISELSKNKRDFLQKRLADLVNLYPFNEYEYIISNLLGFNKISLNDYYEIRDEYISRNMYLYIFEIASPRKFGEMWAQGHIMEIAPSFIKPSKKYDYSYNGEYDLVLPYKDDIIKVEVKASRAVDGDSDEPLFVKALSSDSNKSFWMNFQQIKPACADVFIWIAVWRDLIKYWILSSNEVETNRYYSPGQHRGNQGEGQLHIKDDNIKEFEKYSVSSDKIKYATIEAYKKQLS